MSATFFSDQKDWFLFICLKKKRIACLVCANTIVGAETEQSGFSAFQELVFSLWEGDWRKQMESRCADVVFLIHLESLHSKPFILNNEPSNVRVMYFLGSKVPTNISRCQDLIGLTEIEQSACLSGKLNSL